MADGKPTVLLWSGGKDAALALEALQADPAYEVRALLTTLWMPAVVTIHGVSRALIVSQADTLGLPVHFMRLPSGAPNAAYEATLEDALAPLRAEGIEVVASGDVYLADVRAYRERVLRKAGVEPAFPLWEADTHRLARGFIERGYRAVVVSVDTEQLTTHFAGRDYDAALLSDLPAGVDPCGENGEFHTFVTDGPPFMHPVPVAIAPAEGEGRMQKVSLCAA